MNLLMISGDRSMLDGKKGAFWYTLEAFSKEWDRIDVICPQSKGAKTMQTFFGNVHVHPCPRGLWYQARWIRQRGNQLYKHFKHAVMTVHDYPPFYNGLGARRLARDTGIPYVLEIHHIVGHPHAASCSEYFGRVMSRLYLPGAIHRANGARAVSKTTAETLINWGAPKAKIHVVPSFYLDREMFERLGEQPPTQYDAVFCGRLVVNKGLPDILRAIALLKRARLLVIGDGPERMQTEKLAKSLGIEHRVEFRGWLPSQADVLRAIRSAKVLLMNSTSEGGPRVPLEAMAAGMPVIVTQVGVMPDVLVDGVNGMFTTGKPEDLATKLQRIIDDDELRRAMGAEAAKILDRFERGRLITMYAHFLRSFA